MKFLKNLKGPGKIVVYTALTIFLGFFIYKIITEYIIPLFY